MSGSRGTPLASFTRLAAVLARQWWPQIAALAAACGVVATTIAGALCVGGSMEAGLRQLAVGRLGRINAALVGETFMTGEIASRLAERSRHGGPAALVPALVMPVTVSAGGSTARATLLACNDPAGLGFEPTPPPLPPAGILINPPLAATLGVAAGDAVVLRLPKRSGVPADNPLGRRTGESDGRRLPVSAVLPPQGIGSFSLRPVQATGPLVVTSLEVAQRILRRGNLVNAVFAVGMPAGDDAAAWLREMMEPSLADFGLRLEAATTEPESLRLVADRLILAPAVDHASQSLLGPLGGQPTLVFLANALTPLNGLVPATASVPYSTVLGIPSTTLPVGGLEDEAGAPLPLPDDEEIIIDRWMADDLAAQGRPVVVGDTLRLSLFQPETVHGRVTEMTADLRISGIAAMRAAAIARETVPEVEGITDEDSIANWDPPFPFDASRVRTTPPHDEDDRYWKSHQATPKAFVSLATARRLAGSRFGDTTAWLIPAHTVPDPAAVEAQLAAALPASAMGLRVLPLRADAEAASRGSTPFGSLFLALSSFVIAAGLLLEGLLFALLVAARRRDLGILAAVGFAPARVARLLLTVGGIAAVAGVVAGTLLGPLWARALLAWLGAAWTAEVEAGAGGAFTGATPAAGPLVGGAAAALGISLAALGFAAWRAAAIPPLRLLRGGDVGPSAPGQRRWGTKVVAGVGLGVAAVAVGFGRTAAPTAALGLFFTAGFGGLAGLLAMVRLWLAAGPSPAAVRSLGQLARRNLAFAPGRAFSVAAIVASASFLIVAVSAFVQRPPDDTTARSSPTGGWTDIVSFGAATSVDPSDPQAEGGLGITAAEEDLLAHCTIQRLRSSGGDDAACTNLYATLRPTVIGVGPGFVARGGFSFAAHAASTAAEDMATANPWLLLEQPRTGGTAAIPAILDQATAAWGLKLGGVGAKFTVPDDEGQLVEFEIVGLLEPGILQGLVLVAERDFERMFPERSGYGMALVDASGVAADRRGKVATALAAAWADAGISITSATDRLASLQAVQNTFLSGFQALGTLGLLLGTAGVAAVQLQSVFERIGPLTVLRAVGFALGRVRWMLVLETLTTVMVGLGVGILAACLAVAPALAGGEARLPLRWIAITTGTSLAAAVLAAGFAASRGVIPTRPSQD